jgi:hypothetical protein
MRDYRAKFPNAALVSSARIIRTSKLNRGKKLPHTLDQKKLISQKLKGRRKPEGFGCSMSVRQTGKKFSESRKENIRKSLLGKKVTDATKEKMRQKRIGKPFVGNLGFRSDLGFYVRSSFEANYARILKLINVPFKYECQRFFLFDKLGNKIASYCPDFYFPETDSFVELKGWMGPKSKWLIDEFVKQYPKVKFKVLMQDDDEWKQLTQKYSKLIPEWEF